MSLENELSNAGNDPAVPKEWAPYVETVGTQIGSAIVKLPRPGATEEDLLLGAGFDPEEWRIEGPINTRKWMAYHGDWLYYYKFNVVAGVTEKAQKVIVDELRDYIRDRALKSSNKVVDDDCFTLLISDWQVGKQEKGVGTNETVRRTKSIIQRSADRVRELRASGRAIPNGALVGLGDLIEAIQGHYSSQTYSIDANLRDQINIATDLVIEAISTLAPLFDSFTVAWVGGNHGEAGRVKGKQITDSSDNMDNLIADMVKRACDAAGANFIWHIPQHDLYHAVELGGVKVGLHHGHLAFKGSTQQQKLENWWINQEFGDLLDCQVLLSGHYHTPCVNMVGSGKTHIQNGTTDPGSEWYKNSTGKTSPPSQTTVVFTRGNALGWDDYKLIEPESAV